LALLPVGLGPAGRLAARHVHRRHIAQDVSLRHAEGGKSTRNHRPRSAGPALAMNDHPAARSQFFDNSLNNVAKHIDFALRVVGPPSAEQIFELDGV
jgi:hypothetical protein